jgi:hypothetical protein
MKIVMRVFFQCLVQPMRILRDGRSKNSIDFSTGQLEPGGWREGLRPDTGAAKQIGQICGAPDVAWRYNW